MPQFGKHLVTNRILMKFYLLQMIGVPMAKDLRSSDALQGGMAAIDHSRGPQLFVVSPADENLGGCCWLPPCWNGHMML